MSNLHKNYKQIVKNYEDERRSPAYRWHILHGAGHLLGEHPNSQYFRENQKIKCDFCDTKCHAEKELTRHVRNKHEGKVMARTPNATYLRMIDISQLTEENKDRPWEILLPFEAPLPKPRG